MNRLALFLLLLISIASSAAASTYADRPSTIGFHFGGDPTTDALAAKSYVRHGGVSDWDAVPWKPDTTWDDSGQLPYLHNAPRPFDPPHYHMRKGEDDNDPHVHLAMLPTMGNVLGTPTGCTAFNASHQNYCTQNAIGITTGRAPCWQVPNLIEMTAATQIGAGPGGQLGQYLGPNYAANLAARDAMFHTFNGTISPKAYMPGVDGPTGAQCASDSGTGGSSLKAISSWTNCVNATRPCTGTSDPTGSCAYWTTAQIGTNIASLGYPYTTVPAIPNDMGTGGSATQTIAGVTYTLPNFLWCRPTSNSNLLVDVNGWDFTNEGGGNMTSQVMIYLAPGFGSVSNVELYIHNSFGGCPNTAGTGPGAWCANRGLIYNNLTGTTTGCPNCGSTGGSGWIVQVTSGGAEFDIVRMTNDTWNGNAENIIAAKYLAFGANTSFAPADRIFFINTGWKPPVVSQGVPKVFTLISENNVFESMGHAFAQPWASTDLEMHATLNVHTCISGFSGCHGEILEGSQERNALARPTMIQHIEDGSMWIQGIYGGDAGSQVYPEVTAPVYMTSGGPNGLIITDGVVSDFWTFMNGGGNTGLSAGCSNARNAGPYTEMTNWTYSPANPCVIVAGANDSIISTGWGPYIQNLTLQFIMTDQTSFNYCSTVGTYNPRAGAPVTAIVANFSGTTWTIQEPPPQNPIGTDSGTGSGVTIYQAYEIWPGNTVADYAGQVTVGNGYSSNFTTTYTIGTAALGQVGNANPFNNFATLSSPSPGILAVSSPITLAVGQPIVDYAINGTSIYGYVQSSTCPATACASINTQITGTQFQLVTTKCFTVGTCTASSTNFGPGTLVRSYNDGGDAIPALTISGAATSFGALNLASPAILQIGELVFNNNGSAILGFIQEGCPGSCATLNTATASRTDFQLVQFQNSSTLCTGTGGQPGQQFCNKPTANSTANTFFNNGTLTPCTAGVTIECGTYTVANSEPTTNFIGRNSEWGLMTHIDTLNVGHDYSVSYSGAAGNPTQTATPLSFTSFQNPQPSDFVGGQCN